nr:WG repeat-containing protein [Tatlockia sp.]
DRTGKQVISPQFDLANSFSEGLAAVKIKDKCGYINKIGKVVVKRRFSACEDFAEGLAAVKTFGQ